MLRCIDDDVESASVFDAVALALVTDMDVNVDADVDVEVDVEVKGFIKHTSTVILVKASTKRTRGTYTTPDTHKRKQGLNHP